MEENLKPFPTFFLGLYCLSVTPCNAHWTRKKGIIKSAKLRIFFEGTVKSEAGPEMGPVLAFFSCLAWL